MRKNYFKDEKWLVRKSVKTITRPHSNVCVLVTAITNEKDNCKLMLDATIRVCSLSAELIKLVGKRLAVVFVSSDFTFCN